MDLARSRVVLRKVLNMFSVLVLRGGVVLIQEHFVCV